MVKSSQKIEINYQNETLIVEGNYTPYHPGDFRETPPSPAEFDIIAIHYNGGIVDCNDFDIEEIELICIENIENGKSLDQEFNEFIP